MDRILEDIDASGQPGEDGKLCSGEPDCSPAAFSHENFHTIPETTQSSADKSKMTFIDGGNAELFSSPDTSVHFIRIFHTVYRDNRRINCSSDEFYVLCQAKNQEDSIIFSAKLFKSSINSLTDSFFEEKFLFNPLDPALLERSSRLTIDKVPGMIRRIAELSTALLLVGSAESAGSEKSTDRGDIIVIDGDFCTKTVAEKKLLSALHSVAGKRGISVAGLSKTSSLLTSKGMSVAETLSAAAPFDAWYYYPAAQRLNTNICFAKLNPKSDYIFKIEMLDGTDPETIIPFLASNSTDAVFLGYPYGLIEADRFARIPNREKDMLRTMFMAKAGKAWEHLDSRSKSLDAHSVLDNIL